MKYITIAFYLVAALFSPFKLLSRAFLNRNKIKPSVLTRAVESASLKVGKSLKIGKIGSNQIKNRIQ